MKHVMQFEANCVIHLTRRKTLREHKQVTSPDIKRLFLGPLSRVSENVIKIRSFCYENNQMLAVAEAPGLE